MPRVKQQMRERIMVCCVFSEFEVLMKRCFNLEFGRDVEIVVRIV